ncbi:hypothetical protein H8L32_25760 [Undibacterium sp. CY18W]|uniref:Uncharacterized protein n=1 Tax=Undibacterium hunanense TaxID=2762292 RepID=A0ABR6ZYD4_9BURK|nr:hypothetical protein [Undibacterium hunanense]MBC3920897.1 hypothetical protein [Undibacterium hunanense]
MISWFSAKEAKDFGLQLAEFVVAQMPTELAAKKDKTFKKRIKILQQLEQKIHNFKLEHRLNIYKKAQFGNVFKWHLLEQGFDKEVVEELTNIVMKEIGK